MAISLSDLSEEDRALILQQAKEELGDRTTNDAYSAQVVYLNHALGDFVKALQDRTFDAKFSRSAVSDKVLPFVNYLMKMKLVSKYGVPSNTQARAKTEDQLKDFQFIVDEVFTVMYNACGLTGGK